MIAVKVHTDQALKKMRGRQLKFKEKTPKRVIRKIAKAVMQQMIMRAPMWRGWLKGNITIKNLGKNTIGISTLFYGPIIEAGHRIPPGTRPPMLVAWARQKLGFEAGERWLKKVYRYGAIVKPIPFMKESINAVKGNLKRYIDPEIKEAIR